ARLQRVSSPPTGSPAPHAAHPIAVSVLADSIYLVDPVSGTSRTVVSGLHDFQSGFATWAPDQRRLAYGDSGVFVLDTATGEAQRLIAGPSVSMPAWGPTGQQIAYG